MLLHACLLLFIITTDKTWASSPYHCGGNVSLDQEASGLTLPGLYSDTSRLKPINKLPDKAVCTWTIDIPLHRTVRLKLVWLESGSTISVLCVLNEGDRVLERGGTALLSGCDRNKATLSWTGAGNSSNAAQLVYHVQEDERNSSEDRSTHHPDHGDLIGQSQTGTSFTSTAPVGQAIVRGTAGGGGHFYEGLEWSPGPVSVSSALSEDQGLQHPTLPQQSHPVAGRTDRETLLLPEEKPNNGADTSGAVHLTDSPMAARERTHPYFQQADTKSNTANPNGGFALTDTTVNGFLSTSTQTSKHITTQTDQRVSEPTGLFLASSSSELPSWMSSESHTILLPHGGAVSGTPGGKRPNSWRSQRSTDTLNSNLTSTTTSDPLQSSSKPPQPESDSTHTADTEPTSSSSSQGPSRTQSSTTHIADLHTAVGTVEAASLRPNISQRDSFVSAAADVTARTPELSEKFENTEMPPTVTSSTRSQTTSPPSTESLSWSSNAFSAFTQEDNKETQTTTESTQRDFMNADTTIDNLPSTTEEGWTSGFSGSFSTPTAVLTTGGVVQSSAATTETHTLHPANTHSPTPVPLLSSTSADSSTPSYMLQTHTLFLDSSHITFASSGTESAVHTAFMEHETTSMPSQTSRTPPTHTDLPTSANISPTRKQYHNFITTTRSTIKSDDKTVVTQSPTTTSTYISTAGPPQHPSPRTAVYPSQGNNSSPSTSTPSASSTKSPKFYIVPDKPATIKVESIELLLQIVTEESRSAFTAGLEEDTAAWLEPYLQRAPGFSRLLGVWSSGHAVQNLVEFRTSGALQWLSMTGPTSLLEQTGLAQAVLEKRMFRSSRITNITLGGVQGDVCDWLLQCPTGYTCTSQPGTANYSCSSVCHFDYCHHHGICTHHVGQLPGCHCLVGDDFWYMGQRCDMRMTRARLVGACLAILLIIVTVIGVLALVAVRRYRAILIQAKVDQTRSSYRRFNHFDELSGRFWLRSWAGSADSLDNPAFTRSDELLHLRALDRPCCYHDDTLSLASTCPSHGTHINTIYPISSQYGWRGSEMSMGDGVLDSGKASDLSVCSWPVEPIHWTPFPLLQQLASHRTPTVRVSRPRSYCEGMELVDMGKSWTA